MDKSGFGDMHYFAVMVPEGLFAVAFIAHGPHFFFVAWITSQERGRAWTETLEEAWAFLHEAFGEVQYREVAPARFRQLLAKLRPTGVTLPPFVHGTCKLPNGSIIRRGEAPIRVAPAESTYTQRRETPAPKVTSPAPKTHKPLKRKR